MPRNNSVLTVVGGMALAFTVLIAGCASPTEEKTFSPTTGEPQMAELMARRLEIARRVAWVKFQNGLPVSDPKREAEMLASLVHQGEQLGLPSGEVEVFFKAQIRASRQVQENLIRSWRRGAPLPAYPPWDLRRHLRPELDKINSAMLALLKAQRAQH